MQVKKQQLETDMEQQTVVGNSLNMGILDHLTCLLRHLYAGQEATVRNRHGITDWFHIGKGVP